MKININHEYLYNTNKINKPFSALSSTAEQKVRLAYSDVCNLLHKSIILCENGEKTLSEVRRIERMAVKLEKMIDTFNAL